MAVRMCAAASSPHKSAARRSANGMLAPRPQPVTRLPSCTTGSRTTTAALGAVEETLESNVPAMGYTITYAIGNTLLIIWGVVIVLLVA